MRRLARTFQPGMGPDPWRHRKRAAARAGASRRVSRLAGSSGGPGGSSLSPAGPLRRAPSNRSVCRIRGYCTHPREVLARARGRGRARGSVASTARALRPSPRGPAATKRSPPISSGIVQEPVQGTGHGRVERRRPPGRHRRRIQRLDLRAHDAPNDLRAHMSRPVGATPTPGVSRVGLFQRHDGAADVSGMNVNRRDVVERGLPDDPCAEAREPRPIAVPAPRFAGGPCNRNRPCARETGRRSCRRARVRRPPGTSCRWASRHCAGRTAQRRGHETTRRRQGPT